MNSERRHREAKRNLKRWKSNPSKKEIEAIAELYTPLNKERDDMLARAKDGKLHPDDKKKLLSRIKRDKIELRMIETKCAQSLFPDGIPGGSPHDKG